MTIDADQQLLIDLAQRMSERVYGKHRATVVDNDDPERLGRVRLCIPDVLGDVTSNWALPSVPYGGLADRGMLLVPDVDAQVWAEFEAGNVSRPIWTGTFWQAAGDPPEEAADTAPTTRVLKTAAGHVLLLEDAGGEERATLVHPSGATIDVDPNGTIAMTDAGGASVTLDAAAASITIADANGNSMEMTSSGTTVTDAAGNTIEMAASGVTVKGTMVRVEGSQVTLGGSGGEPLLKGTSFLTLFATHMHPTAMGPTGPPIPQGEASSLSTTVTTS